MPIVLAICCQDKSETKTHWKPAKKTMQKKKREREKKTVFEFEMIENVRSVVKMNWVIHITKEYRVR